MVAFLLTVLIGLFLTIVLPLVSLARAAATRDAVAGLERRLAALEARLRDTPDTALTDAPVPPHGVSPAEPPSASGSAPSEVHTPRPYAPPTHDTARGPAAGTVAARLETRIGTRWMLYVGVAALVIGVGLLIRYAFANQWITEPLRVAFGGLAGLLVLLTGRRAVATGHRRFGTTLVGGSIAIWYLAVHAAVNLYSLLGQGAGFGLLVAVTALAAVQADRLRSQPLATVAVLGGFGAPFLVGGDAATYVSLFSYTALLLGAIVFLAHRCDWPAIYLLSFVLTGLTVPIWHAQLFEDAYLTAELFLTLYAALFLWVQQGMRGSSHPYARWVRLVLWTTPAWYHVASLWVLTPHRLAFLVYLIVATGVGVVFAVRRDGTWSRLVLWVAVAIPLFAWADSQPDPSWLVPAALSWLAIAAMHVAAQVELIRRVRTRLAAADVLLVPMTGLGLCAGLYAVLAPSRYALAAPVAAALAAAYAGLTTVLRRLDPRAARHALSVTAALALAAVAIWFDGRWGSVLLAAQGVGMVWIGLHEQRSWVRAVGGLLLGAATVELLAQQLGPVPASYSVILNQRALLGFFVVGALSAVAWLHARSDAGSAYPIALAAAVVSANLVMLVTLSTEIYAFWHVRVTDFRGARSEFIRHLMLSATWGAYAAALTAAGFKRGYAPIRYLAIGIFSVTVVKVFTVDFSQLDSLYRILSSLALGLLLVGASYLYQRQGASTPPPGSGP
ncbi:MAG: DUF2339 domain-containing protein [Acidobacteria bacterium]|nr:DUF2339 domain-containing protein [Acidobacteriota bacterium]